MNYIMYGKNIEVTEGLKKAVEEKIGKLDRYFTPETEVHATFSVEKDKQKIEITIPMKGTMIRAEQESTDMYASIDMVEEVIERQLRKYKNKLVDKKQSAESFSKAFAAEDIPEDDEIKIVRTKRFAMKPMHVEEACIQMELLGHDFFVFRNAETDEVNVVYKRKGNTYGLIEPENQPVSEVSGGGSHIVVGISFAFIDMNIFVNGSFTKNQLITGYGNVTIIGRFLVSQETPKGVQLQKNEYCY